MSVTPVYYSLSGISKALRYTTPRLQRRFVELAIEPDARVIQQGNHDIHLFKEDRLPAILRALETKTTSKLL
jgi:hypothetical protein